MITSLRLTRNSLQSTKRFAQTQWRKTIALSVVSAGLCIGLDAVAQESGPTTDFESLLRSETKHSDKLFTDSLASFLQEEEDSEISGGLSVDDDADETLRKALKMLEDDVTEMSDDAREIARDVAEAIGSEGGLGKDSIFAGREPSHVEGRFLLPKLEAATTAMDEIGNGSVPEGLGTDDDVAAKQLPESGLDRGLPWHWTVTQWAAANTFSHPLYFEDRMLERHGHRRCPHLQPLVSGARFVGSAFLLPYKSALAPPCHCVSSLGYYRAGNCVPHLKQRPPWARKAAVAQAAWIGAGIWAIP